MSCFYFVNCAKRIIAVALFVTIFTATVSYAAINIDDKYYDIYKEVISDTNFMSKLYDAGSQLEKPMSNDGIDTIIINFITHVMNDSKVQIENGTIDRTNYQEKIKKLCESKIVQDNILSALIGSAFPDATSDYLLEGKIPTDLQPLYHTVGYAVKLQLGLVSTPTPTPTTAPSGGGGGGGGITVPATPTPTPPTSPTPPPSITSTVDTSSFNDLQSVGWAVTAINTLAQAGIISKNTEMMFKPLNNVKREEFVKLIVSGFNLNNPNATSDFTDVDKNSWFYPYVSSMTILNLVKGYNDHSFGAGQAITRQDIAVLLYRVIQHKALDVTPSEPVLFGDDPIISDYAKDAVYMMRQMCIIRGTPENMFKPTSFATRAEAAQMLYNAYKIYIAKE